MAEGVFRHLTSAHPLIGEVDSAGTAAYHTGSNPDKRTMRVLQKNDITSYKHHARPVSSEDFSTFDWIFAMDSDNLDDLKSMRNRAKSKKGKAASSSSGGKESKIMMFGDFGGRKKGEEVIDPYYGADNGFDIAYEQMGRFTEGFLKHLEDTRTEGGSSKS